MLAPNEGTQLTDQICPICRSTSLSFVYQLYDDRYGYPNTYDLHKCKTCQHEFLPTSFSEQELTELYTDFYPRRKFNPDNYRAHVPLIGLEAFWRGAKCNAFRWVPENVSVLDIGCGYANALGYHRNRGCRVAGVELDENARIIAKRQGFDIKIGGFRADMFDGETFDYVTLDQVIEHVQTPHELMKDVCKVLKPGGRVILTTPNAKSLWRRLFGRKWIHWHTPYHIQFFNRSSMATLAKGAGLEIESLQMATTPEWLNYQWVHLATCPEPGEPSVFWAVLPRPQSMAKWFRAIGLVHRSGFNHLLTRLIDTLHLGDNQIYVLKRHD